jgi:hypothetical protein
MIFRNRNFFRNFYFWKSFVDCFQVKISPNSVISANYALLCVRDWLFSRKKCPLLAGLSLSTDFRDL